ncbi:unnamed protein product [Closterium sp. NIES-65]|nr:unnamed protein product [Closterium sp. NIES-65]
MNAQPDYDEPSTFRISTMERAPPLLFVLLCAAFFTAAAASASIFPPFLARDGSASTASAGQFAKKQKGKVIDKYVAKLHPPWSGGKAIGDKGASGKMILKAVMYSVQAFLPSSAASSTTMERAPPLLVLLLCLAFFTAAAASASNFPPLLARDGSASAASAAQDAKPLAKKGKVIDKYVVKLRPPKENGKVIGDKGASGKCATKSVMYSSTSYAYVLICKVFKIASGGKKPASANMRTCTNNGGVQELVLVI